jgi:hypothetical protein
VNTAALTAEAEAGYNLDELIPRFVVHGTPVTRLAGLIVAAIDAGDVAMARRCAQRLIELGGKR